MLKKLGVFAFLALTALCLSGCLTHWFVDTESRLQVENATENITLYGLDVMAVDSSSYEVWMKETLLPGERSHVVVADWIGEFNVRVRYGTSEGNEQESVETLNFEGGSLFLRITSENDSLIYTFK